MRLSIVRSWRGISMSISSTPVWTVQLSVKTVIRLSVEELGIGENLTYFILLFTCPCPERPVILSNSLASGQTQREADLIGELIEMQVL